MSSIENRGLSIFIASAIGNPVIYSENITSQVDSYSHTISAVGGFDTASITMSASREKLDEYTQSAVGGRIAVYNESGAIMWEGFINSIEYTYGGQQTKRGPLFDVANRVSVSYAPLDISTSPPTTGRQTYTTIVEDFTSQSKYGILETIVSGGTIQDADATNIGDLYLLENKYANTSNTISIEQSSNPYITFDCLGYYHWLDKYVYNCSDAGTVTISDRIKDILDFNPNTEMYGELSIDDNLWLIVAFNEDNKTALTHIKELLSYGDSNDNRFTLGCYENRNFKYRVVPTTYTYLMSSSEGANSITTLNGQIVEPWNVRPGNWLLITDMLVGAVQTPLPNKDDSRAIFIEKVSFSLPYNLTINGEKISTFKQRLAVFAGIGSF